MSKENFHSGLIEKLSASMAEVLELLHELDKNKKPTQKIFNITHAQYDRVEVRCNRKMAERHYFDTNAQHGTIRDFAESLAEEFGITYIAGKAHGTRLAEDGFTFMSGMKKKKSNRRN